MKKTNLAFVLIFLAGSIVGQPLQNEVDSISYALGSMLYNTIKKQGIKEVDVNVIAKAVEDGMSDKKVALYPDEAAIYMRNYVKAIKDKNNEALKEKGLKFLSENAEKPGVIALESGLQYEVLKEGEGPSPTATDKVKAHYQGQLIDGTVFDSSYDRGEPLTLPVNRVIKGWQEALQIMKVGDKWRLFIPYDLAYGEKGAGRDIPPFATLIFELELLSIL